MAQMVPAEPPPAQGGLQPGKSVLLICFNRMLAGHLG
jgi:hypothetical protein